MNLKTIVESAIGSYLAEVAQPKAEDEINFKEKHMIKHIVDPNAEEDSFTADGTKKFKNRADYEEGEDEDVYESLDIGDDDEDDKSSLYKKLRSKAFMKHAQQQDEEITPVHGAGGEFDEEETHRKYKKGNKSVKMPIKESAIPDGYFVHDHKTDKLIHKISEPFKDSKTAISKANAAEDKNGYVHTVHHIKGGKIVRSWQYSPDHKGYAHYDDYKGESPFLRESVTQTVSKDFKGIRRTDNLKIGDKVKSGPDYPAAANGVVKDVHPHGVRVRWIGATSDAFVTHPSVVKLEEAFSAGPLKLTDGTSATLSKPDAVLLNKMFTDLNPANKKKMQTVLLKDKSGFEEILGFAKEAL